MDKFLNSLDISQLWDLRKPVIAVCGEFMIGGSWKYLNTSVQGISNRQPLLVIDGNLMSPVYFFDKEYDLKVKNRNYRINFFKKLSIPH